MLHFRTVCFIAFVFTFLLLRYCIGLREPEDLSSLEPHCPEKCSCSSHFKRVSCMGQQLRSVPEDIPLSVKRLYLSHNYLTEIETGAFENLTNLTTLSLIDNLIDKIADGAFRGLINLEVLYLKNNQLTTLSPEVFRDLYSLSDIYLTQNKLVEIPDMRYAENLIYLTLDNNELESAHFRAGFRNLTRLSTVVLSNNPKLVRITDADFDALNRSTVRKIALSRCGLNNVGDQVFNFPRLQSLCLSYNLGWNETFLRRVLSLLVNCSELSSLDLSGAVSLPTLPADIFESLAEVPLSHLNLAHTEHIAVVDKGTFQYFPVLEKLDLRLSDFSIIQDSMSQMKKLKTLNLSQNKLQLVPILNLPSLQSLDISYCTFIQDLEDLTFLHLPALSELVMQSCGIHRICKDAFRGLYQLKTLDLSHNAVGSSSLSVNLFSPLSQLSKLDLSNNKLKQIITEKDLFKHLQTLTVLDFSGNDCSMLPVEIFNPLSSLISLDLSRNRLGDGVISQASGSKLLDGLAALEEVRLMENDIYGLPAGFFDRLSSLRVVNLSSNHLDWWNGSAFNDSANLSLVDFSWNKITTVSEQSVIPLAANVKLNLSDNPFECWCDLIWFRNWITLYNITDEKLPGLDAYKCSSPLEMANKLLLDFDPETITKSCSPPPWIIITVGSGIGVAVIIILLVSVCYRYRWPIRLKMYKLRKRMRRDRDYERMDEEAENEYDVYVSYGPSARDKNWVKETLIPVIDRKERAKQTQQENVHDAGESGANAAAVQNIREFQRVNAYWEGRDLRYGTSEIGAVAEAIYGSRKVMLVVSLEYLRDGRRSFEIQIAVDKSCRAQRQLADIIIVLLDREAAVRLPPELHGKIEGALQWTPDDENGQELFWQRLQDLLHSEIPQPDII